MTDPNTSLTAAAQVNFHGNGDETATRYAAGTLPEPELPAFESHLVGCARCQDAVRFSDTLRLELGSTRTRRRWKPTAILGALAAAAAVTFVLISPQRDPVRELGRLAAGPAYGGVVVRADDAPADSIFAHGMDLYARGNYSGADTVLKRARVAGADSALTGFFIGASLLMVDRAQEAANEFATVVRIGETPYLAEGRYYLAKSLLRLGQVDDAIRQLVATERSESPIAEAARALRDSIEVVRTRSL